MIEIYIGEPISHESERKLLNALHAHVNTISLSCIVFANFEFEGRQFDFVVLTRSSVFVADAKSISSPIKGEKNGPWARRLPNGQWGTYKNAYSQVLDCKNRLRNRMSNVPAGFFPEGHVVFVDDIPSGSSITMGDFKVSVTGLTDFLGTISKVRTNPWSFERWRNFAVAQNLIKVQLHEAFDDRGSELIQRYRFGFIQDYQSEAERWLPEDDLQALDLLSAAKNGIGLFINGPSGCGKTLAVKSLAVDLSKEGFIVFFLTAKTFNGSFSGALHTEVSLVSDSNYIALIKALSKRGVNPYFIIDGLNEMSEDLSKVALRGLKTLARRYGAKVIVTSQATAPSSLSALEVFEFSEPSSHLKLKIAESFSKNLSLGAIQVLSSVKSGLEAEIVGRIQTDLDKDTTRLILVDQYIRHRLGRSARAGSALLRCFATWLMEKVVFSVAETEFDIYMARHGFTMQNCDDVLNATILVRRAGRLSFSHEMYYYACASHAYILDASENPKVFGKMLNTPVYRPLAVDILSAIEDEVVCRSLLESTDNSSLLADAADGNLGRIVEKAALYLLHQASEQVMSDISNARLKIDFHENTRTLCWEEGIQTDFSPEESAQYQAIGLRAARGTGVENYLSLCRMMDEHLKSEVSRLSEIAQVNKIPLRSESFQLAYLGFGSKFSFSIAAGSTSGYFEQKSMLQELKISTLSSGELYFVLESQSVSYWRDKVWFAEEIINIVTNRLRYEPYHVKLSILSNSYIDASLGQDIINRLIEAIEGVDPNTLGVWGGSIIFDALGALGGLEQEAESYREYVKNEVKMALDGEGSDSSYEKALGVYDAIYDHPYSRIFDEELYSLPLSSLHKLYRRALRAPSSKQSFGLTSLAGEVAQIDDSGDCNIFSQFAELPTKSHVFPQNEIAVFVLAVRFLARHGHPLPPVEITDGIDLCFDALRKIIYVLQPQLPSSISVIRRGWCDLEKCRLPHVISCLKEVFDALLSPPVMSDLKASKIYSRINIVEACSKEVLHLGRKFIALRELAKTRHGHDDRSATAFAFNIIGEYGDRSDLRDLRDLMGSPKLAEHALKAIKSIEGRG